MSTKHYCDRCGGEIHQEGNSIHEGLHPTPTETAEFRMHIHFLKKFSEGKADLCDQCVIALLIEKASEYRQIKRAGR